MATKVSIEKLPPGPKPLPLAGNLIDFLRQGPDIFESSARTFGDITTVSFGSRKHFVINDPAVIQNILIRDRKNFEKGRALGLARTAFGSGLLTSDGEVYQKQRRVVQPVFSMRNVAEFCESVQLFLDRLRSEWTDGFEIDVSHAMAELCLKIAAHGFFGLDISEFAAAFSKAFESTLATLNQLNLLPPIAERLPLPVNFRLRRLRKQLQEIADFIIERGRQSGERGTDLLALLVASYERDVEAGLSEPACRQALREQVITFLVAGYEAPYRALAWTWYLLGREGARTKAPRRRQSLVETSPERKLLEEIERAVGSRPPTFDDIPNLPYTRAVVSEAMRLYPPVWIIARKILTPYEVGGFTLPANSEVFLSPYITQRDPRFFSDPLEFCPDRWLDPKIDQRPRYSYFPFGGGLRGCAGEHFAWPELVLVVASIAQRWRLRLKDESEVKPNPAFTFGPKTPILVTVEARSVSTRESL